MATSDKKQQEASATDMQNQQNEQTCHSQVVRIVPNPVVQVIFIFK